MLDVKKRALSLKSLPERFRVRALRILRVFVKITLLLVVSILAILLGYRLHYFLFVSPYFRVTRVEMLGVSPEVKTEALKFAELDKLEKRSYNLFRLNTSRIRRTLMNMPKIRVVEVYKEYPNTLRILAQPRKPIILILGYGLYIADSEGVIIDNLAPEKRKEFKFPVMTGIPSEEVRVGGVIKSPVFFKAIDLQSAMAKQCEGLYEQLSELNLNDRGEITAIFNGGTEIRFGRHEVLERLPELEAFLNQHSPSLKEFKKFQYVDLRFQKQIVYALRGEKPAAVK